MKNNKKSKITVILDRIAGFIIVTVFAIGIGALAAGAVLLNGPSESLNNKMKSTFLETRRFTFVPYIYKSAEEVDEVGYVNSRDSVNVENLFDNSLINVGKAETESSENWAAQFGLTDEDNDGFIFHKFTYKGSTYFMMIVQDPSRVFVGTAIRDPNANYGYGRILDDIVADYDALGGINAGGFIDDDGAGAGWPPDGITYSEGVCFNPNPAGPVAGIDENGILFVAYLEYQNCEDFHIRDAVSFGPILIQNGEEVDQASLDSGINPRTAIGQCADGTIILMVVDGRQAYSIGASFADCADVLFNFGCINAINMDGGNSTSMFYDGEIVNNPTNPAGGTRNLPDAWLVRK